jgi:[acyl-carrier-protein] S-malonyltransferase
MKTALLFAGQGAQTVGMGRDLCEKFDACRQIFARANEILGYDLQKICFDGPDSELTKTDNAQPAIYVASLACWAALKSQIDVPFSACAGLSLGEITALDAAGAVSFEHGLRITRQRGRFMQEACDATHGAMAAILGLDETAVREICKSSDVDLANLLGGGQIVISGEKEKVAAAIELAKSRGAKRALPLNVAGAYHSRLMMSAQPKLRALLAEIAIHPPKVTVISNVTGKPLGENDDICELLVEQVCAPVRWEESMRWLLANGFSRFIELGPGTVLSGLLRRIDKNAEVLNVADVKSLESSVGKLRQSA